MRLLLASEEVIRTSLVFCEPDACLGQDMKINGTSTYLALRAGT